MRVAREANALRRRSPPKESINQTFGMARERLAKASGAAVRAELNPLRERVTELGLPAAVTAPMYTMYRR